MPVRLTDPDVAAKLTAVEGRAWMHRQGLRQLREYQEAYADWQALAEEFDSPEALAFEADVHLEYRGRELDPVFYGAGGWSRYRIGGDGSLSLWPETTTPEKVRKALELGFNVPGAGHYVENPSVDDSVATDRKLTGEQALADLQAGRGALVPRSLVKHLKPEEAGPVLDYGCGSTAPHVQALDVMGYDIVGYDIGDDDVGLVDKGALRRRKYNVVLASNVVNVQPSWAALNTVLDELRLAAGTRGMVIMNLAEDPRWLFNPGATGDEQLHQRLKRRWLEIGYDRPGGNTKVWWCRGRA